MTTPLEEVNPACKPWRFNFVECTAWKSFNVVLQLTAVYLNNGYPSSTRQVVNAPLPLMPDEPLFWGRAGDVGMKEEDFTWAVEAYRNALALGDTTLVDLRNLGLALYLTQAYWEAVGYFEQAYATDSTDKLNTFYLAMTHQRLGAYEEALFYFEQAKALMGAAALADIATQMGVALDALDWTGEAVEAFDLSLRLDEKERDALFYLARLYDKRGNTEEARSYYSEFLSSVSEDEMPQLQDMARERLTALQAADSPELQASAAADTLATDSTCAPE